MEGSYVAFNVPSRERKTSFSKASVESGVESLGHEDSQLHPSRRSSMIVHSAVSTKPMRRSSLQIPVESSYETTTLNESHSIGNNAIKLTSVGGHPSQSAEEIAKTVPQLPATSRSSFDGNSYLVRYLYCFKNFFATILIKYVPDT